MTRTKKVTEPAAPYAETFETFRHPGYALSGLTPARGPSCFNGMVHIRKYRVTAALIDEPIEVLRERVTKLWRECDNMHHMDSLQKAAKDLGIDVGVKEWINQYGVDRKRNKA